MKNSLIANLSPREKGTSAMLCRICSDFLKKSDIQTVYHNLYDHEEDMSELLEAAQTADTIVPSGCYYIHAYPVHTTLLL